jgi:hypothetical protein
LEFVAKGFSLCKEKRSWAIILVFQRCLRICSTRRRTVLDNGMLLFLAWGFSLSRGVRHTFVHRVILSPLVVIRAFRIILRRTVQLGRDLLALSVPID